MSPILVVSGGFDPIHVGHVRLIADAGRLGNVLVLLNSDSWLIRKKGRFFMSFDERKEVVEAMKWVLQAMRFDDEDGTAIEGLKKAQIAYPCRNLVFCNGGDRTDQNIPEADFCREHGIGLLFGLGGNKIQSSSRLLEAWDAA